MIRPLLCFPIIFLLGAVSTGRGQALLDTARTGFVLDSLSQPNAGGPFNGTRGALLNATKLSFDHILSIYEWDGEFRFARIIAAPISPTTPRFPYSQNNTQWDTVYLSGKSRFLEDNAITSTEALGFISADEPLGTSYPFKPFLTFFGSSYVTTGLPGEGTASLITRQTDGFGIAGLRSQLPGSDIDVSLGGGIARQSQQGMSDRPPGTEKPLSAYGAIVRGDLAAPAEVLTENTLLQAEALADERFYHERNQRYSNDRIALRAASTLFSLDTSRDERSSRVHSYASAGANIASLKLGLNRRDYFISQDSSTQTAQQSVKQERTEYSMLLVDSLSYPITEHHLAGDASVEFEPRSVVRRSDANTGLFVSELSSLLSLLAPNEVSSLRLAVAGRLDYESQGLSRIPEDHSAFWGVETRIRYEEQSENVRLLSNEIAGADQSSISKLSSTLDEASFATRSTTAGVAVHYSPGDERSSIHNLIRLSGNARLLNYDTPSDLNDDDHDELVTSLEAHYDRVFSDALTFSVGVTASRTHLVYLKSDRSAQNNVTQSLALTTEATYSRPEIITHVRGEVFANYTVLDYLNILPSLQEVGNYVLRGASLSDSILFSLGIHPSATLGPITFEEGMSLRLSERGNFNADAFTERRDTRMAEIGATALFGISSQTGLAPWSIRVGARGFVLSTSGRSANNPTPASAFGELERQTRIGPMVQISLLRWASVDERSSTFEPVLSASAWYAVIKSETFDVPSVTRTPQLESHLQVQWTF